MMEEGGWMKIAGDWRMTNGELMTEDEDEEYIALVSKWDNRMKWSTEPT